MKLPEMCDDEQCFMHWVYQKRKRRAGKWCRVILFKPNPLWHQQFANWEMKNDGLGMAIRTGQN